MIQKPQEVYADTEAVLADAGVIADFIHDNDNYFFAYV